MKNTCPDGFTLIELLVVVLIIGILASVALPQYQKAVEKSRATQALVVLDAIGKAVRAHYMSGGVYPESFDELSVDMSGWTGNEKWSTQPRIIDTRSNGEWSLQLYRNSQGGLNLYMGRLKGKYKGAGFVRFIVKGDGDFSPTGLYCAERISEGVVYTGEEGSYCVSLFHASGPGEGMTTARAYVMR